MNKEEELLQKFKEVHPKLIDDILGCPELKEVSIVREWYRKVFEYNTAGGKLNRGLLVVQCYLSMVEKCQINDENTHLACVLGWCLEMLQSWLLVIDDLMDNSSTRRGQPCWYLTNDLGTKAANDGLIIEAATYYILKKYFRNKPYYVDVLELFHSVTFQTTLGQCLDTHSYLTNGKLDFDKTSMDLFLQIAKYKTAYYTLYMPIALGMLMARQNDTDLLKAIENTVIPIGIYFQVQDDYLDCFGDPSTTGKIGTDIQDGKCTWLLAKALELGTPEQVVLIKIAAKKLRNAILSSIKFEVYADPEEFPIGTGGSSIHCLNRLFEKYGENIFSKRILVVHAGGFSKRLPNHSIFGKIFSPVSVHGHNIRDLLDLKIEFTQRFCPFMVNGGVFFAASDDVETFTLEGLKIKDFRNFEGVVALAHPSSLEIGKNHGVYVLSLPTPGSSLAWLDDDCTEVLQKPSVSAMRSHGCTFTNNGAECVYSDSCFWITPSVAHKLLELERHFDIYKKETCIYGNFLTCLGRNKNIIKVGDSLQQAICEALKETPLRVLVLKNSNFYHLGTIKEYLDNLTKNRDMRETYNFIVQSTGFLKDVSVMCSHIKPDCYLSASVVEFSVIQMPVRGERIILSNVQLIGREAIDLPSGWLFHTIPINVQASVKYVTIAMHENDNPKQKCSNSRIVFGEVFIETLTSFDGVELWNLPLFKACETMTDSFLWTLDFIKTVSAQPENLSLYFSMAECMKRCSIQKMKHFRSLMS